MPIGSLTPGTPTTVTPDPNPPRYTSVQGPAVDGDVVATDVLSAHLVALNIQARLEKNHPGLDVDAPWIPIPLGSAVFEPTQFSRLFYTSPPNGTFDADVFPVIESLYATRAAVWVQISPFLPSVGLLRGLAIDTFSTQTYTDVPNPEDQPRLSLFSYAGASIQKTSWNTEFTDYLVCDNQVTTAQFVAPHTIEMTAMSIPAQNHPDIDLATVRDLWVRLQAEFGTNGKANRYFYNLRANVVPYGSYPA